MWTWILAKPLRSWVILGMALNPFGVHVVIIWIKSEKVLCRLQTICLLLVSICVGTARLTITCLLELSNDHNTNNSYIVASTVRPVICELSFWVLTVTWDSVWVFYCYVTKFPSPGNLMNNYPVFSLRAYFPPAMGWKSPIVDHVILRWFLEGAPPALVGSTYSATCSGPSSHRAGALCWPAVSGSLQPGHPHFGTRHGPKPWTGCLLLSTAFISVWLASHLEVGFCCCFFRKKESVYTGRRA